MQKEQASTELKIAQHDVAIAPPAKRRRYQDINKRLNKYKLDYAQGRKSVLDFLRVAGPS